MTGPKISQQAVGLANLETLSVDVRYTLKAKGTYIGDGTQARKINVGFTPFQVTVTNTHSDIVEAYIVLSDSFSIALGSQGNSVTPNVFIIPNGFVVAFTANPGTEGNNDGDLYIFTAFG